MSNSAKDQDQSLSFFKLSKFLDKFHTGFSLVQHIEECIEIPYLVHLLQIKKFISKFSQRKLNFMSSQFLDLTKLLKVVAWLSSELDKESKFNAGRTACDVFPVAFTKNYSHFLKDIEKDN